MWIRDDADRLSSLQWRQPPRDVIDDANGSAPALAATFRHSASRPASPRSLCLSYATTLAVLTSLHRWTSHQWWSFCFTPRTDARRCDRRVCLSVRSHISKTTSKLQQIFCGRGSVLLWRQRKCNTGTLCTSWSVDYRLTCQRSRDEVKTSPLTWSSVMQWSQYIGWQWRNFNASWLSPPSCG